MLYVKSKNVNNFSEQQEVNFSDHELEFLNNFSTLEEAVNFCYSQQVNFASLLDRLLWAITKKRDISVAKGEIANRAHIKSDLVERNEKLLKDAQEVGLIEHMISPYEPTVYRPGLAVTAKTPELKKATEKLLQKIDMDDKVSGRLADISENLQRIVDKVDVEDTILSGGVRPNVKLDEVRTNLNDVKKGLLKI